MPKTRPEIDFLALDRLVDRQVQEAMTHTAPPCPSCGGNLVADGSPHVNTATPIVEKNGDHVFRSLEFYRCSDCGELAMRNIELDRTTRREREHEVDNAVKRAELRREMPWPYTLTKKLRRAYEDEVQRQYPRRPDPDYFATWKEAHGLD